MGIVSVLFSRRAVSAGVGLTVVGASAGFSRSNEPASTVFGRDLLAKFAGPFLPPEEGIALGGDIAIYERNFRLYADKHWAENGAKWEPDFYGCGAVDLACGWMRSGEQKWFERGCAKALDYRTRYLEANNYAASAHWAMLPAMFYHWLSTGDEKSRLALAKLAVLLSGASNWNNLENRTEMDNRIQSRILTALLYAHLSDAPDVDLPNVQPATLPDGSRNAYAGQNWGFQSIGPRPPKLREALTRILKTQDADGAFRLLNNPKEGTIGFYNKTYMVGLLLFAFIEYYTYFEPDSRILPSVQKSADFMWEHQWNAEKKAFPYPGASRSEPVAPDLNGLMLVVWGWLYNTLGDPKYKAQGDEMLAGTVTRYNQYGNIVSGAYLTGQKQFNQTYLESYRYVAFRAGKG